MMEYTLIEIERTTVKQLCAQYAISDGILLTDDNLPGYTESVVADASGNEWVDIEGGNVYTFNVIFDDAVSDWFDNEPIYQLCADILPRIRELIGDKYSVLTLWESEFVLNNDLYNGDSDSDLRIKLLGEIDNNKLQHALIIQKKEVA